MFFLMAAVALGSAVGLVLQRNPVHSAMLLVSTLFSVAVLFVLQQAHFLAAVVLARRQGEGDEVAR